MIVSMTGFGRSEFETEQYQMIVEAKTVNHRFLEMNIRMPRPMMRHEDKVRKIVQEVLNRGRVEMNITIEGQGLQETTLQVNWELMRQYMGMLEQTKEMFHLNDSITAKDLMLLPEVTSLIDVEKEDETFVLNLLRVVREAVEQLKGMREKEGESLERDLILRLSNIQDSLLEIHTHIPNVVKNYKERLLAKFQELQLSEYDEQRILTEITIVADRCDISEELVRMDSHLEQFRETLQANEPVGRKLEFIVQEMNREINTIGSKANDLYISKHVVEMKNNLEKIREQVQNIE
ncbi:YicC/YloC family endoribonuclease [Priestia taiwanensis]|uniref:YicC family protein n=1 Tax=Priestia taiwanensis TaxID=1347902 RepID=A0A917AQ03_9BACI|nr:YicC/YloC family endoribonuclease [Priestia taiwanensis]MBM7362895.1 uncharacterized protein (TIGR00255 family) [Priestia taiwanensis]GGE65981.1 hypothetical protein GCM10007140_15190 [Priestia taiwanensis]